MFSPHDVLQRLTTQRARRGQRQVVPAGRSWPADGRGPRVVVEHEDAAWRWAATEVLEDAGYEVAGCAGPHGLADHTCALVETGHCELVDEAHVVVNGLGIRDVANREVLTALRTQRDQIPVIVEVPTPRREELNAAVPGCRTVPFPVRPKDLVGAVDDVLGRRRDS